MSAGRKPFVVVAAIAALVVGFRGTVQAAPTSYTVPNYNFQDPHLVDGQIDQFVWNPTASAFPTAAGSGVLPGTAAGSQCFVNNATTVNSGVDLAISPTGATFSTNKRYTMTVAVGSALGATIMDGQSLAFADITSKALVLSHEDMYPNGWYTTGTNNGGVENMTGFMGWGGFGDISYSLSGNDLIGAGIVKNGDGLMVSLGAAAGTCWSNVRMISQNWAPTYGAGTFNWDNSTMSAWSPSSGGPSGSKWTAGADAVFEGNGGTVTVGQNITSVNSLNFNTDWTSLGSTAAGYQWIPTYTLSGAGAITLTGDAVITAGAGTDNTSNAGGGTSLISCPISGSAGMYKAGAGFLILTGANNYTGGTTVGGGTLMLGYGGTASPLSGGTSGTIQGNIVNLANLAFNYSSAASSAVTTYGGVISNTGSVDILGTGTTTFTGNNTYTGITTIHAGSTLQVGNGSTATAGAIVGDVVNNGTLIFNRAASVNYSGIIYDGSTFFPSTPGANGYSYLYGNEVAQPGNLTQAGPGALTLDNSQMRYTGTTTVSGGALQITGASASMAVLNTTKTNICGFLVLDYSVHTANEASLVSTMLGLLRTAYNGGVHSFQPGYGYQLYSSMATDGGIVPLIASYNPGIGLGWVDNTTTHQVTIMPALYGDANLDGVVNFRDLSILLTHYGITSGMGWSQGDFTYDGAVNFSDLSKLLANYGGTGPLNINNLPALALDSLETDNQAMQLLGKDGITISGATAVPEPSILAMLVSLLVAGGAWHIRRQRCSQCFAQV